MDYTYITTLELKAVDEIFHKMQVYNINCKNFCQEIFFFLGLFQMIQFLVEKTNI